MWKLLNALFCQHSSTDKSACPFTEKVYETCNDCGKLVSVVRTHS